MTGETAEIQSNYLKHTDTGWLP